ncbi:FAS1-like dehydratase domain-containing protein [Candidatus Binatus sp.]|jgi:N-terminal half of MaoC dehydratase|uniref:FAS1-like dehydratase domain-containing protein n=1 Tax=Candidatus Binatus sp. TaxID=2811406 RepID=UPI002B49D0A7|nr:MaoC family dehydratase N-terminal domain-containing protein [Candidatus Binatus sp.]
MSEDTRLAMCPENLHEGMRLGPIHYVVTPERARAFSDAVKARSPEFIVDDRNPEALVSPTMRLQDYALLIATHLKGGKGGVHAKHWCEFHEPMRVGQAVKTEGKITATYRKRGKFYFTLEYESRDAVTDQLLVRQAITSVLLNDKGEMR